MADVSGAQTSRTAAILAVLGVALLTACGGERAGEPATDQIAGALCTGLRVSATPPASETGPVAVNATGVSCSTGTPEYMFAYQRENGWPWVEIRGWGAASSADWFPSPSLASGRYLVSAYARTQGITTNPPSTATTTYLVGDVCKAFEAVTFSPSSPPPVGTVVTITPKATCAGAALPEYKVWHTRPGAKTSVLLRNWGGPNVRFDTTTEPAGLHSFRIETRAVGNWSSLEAAKNVSYLVGDVCNVTTLVAPAAAEPGSALTLTASATCVNGGNPEYTFAYRARGATAWTTIRSWGGAAVEWSTAGLGAGNYDVRVQARGVGHIGSPESSATRKVALGNVCGTVDLQAAPSAPPPVGTTVMLTSNATCSAGGAEYRFDARPPGSTTFTEIRGWGSTMASWDTLGLPAGVHALRVQARGTANPGIYEATRTINYFLGDVCNAVALSLSPKSSASLGETVTMTGSATCANSGTPEYRFSMRPAGGAWVLLTGWGAANFAWPTSALSPGNYQVRVETRGAGHIGNAESSRIAGYVLAKGCASVSLAASPESPSAVGAAISLTAAASCRPGAPASYRFLYRGSRASEFTELSGWGPGAVVWDTTPLFEDDYVVRVEARGPSSPLPYESAAEIPVRLTGSGPCASPSRPLRLPSPSYSELQHSQDSVTAADFNGDGRLDVAAASSAGGVSVLLGLGNGSFRPPIEHPLASGSKPMVASDFDSDGRTDLAVANVLGDDVSILLGNGDGSFRPAASHGAGDAPRDLAAGDVDADGRQDLVVINASSGIITVLTGRGDGTFDSAVAYTGLPRSDSAIIKAGDFNGDGRADVAVLSLSSVPLHDEVLSGPADLAVLLSQGAGTFVRTLTSHRNEQLAGDLEIADFDADGHLDVLEIISSYTDYEGSALMLFSNNGDGTFRASVWSWLWAFGLRSAAAADFDEDGLVDVALTDEKGFYFDDPPVIYWARNDGDRTFSSRSVLQGGRFSSQLARDFNGDSHEDLLVLDAARTGAGVFLGQGDGSLLAPNRIPSGDGDLQQLMSVDFDHDGRPDLITGRGSVFLGRGDALFARAYGGIIASRVAIADFNADGRLDRAGTNGTLVFIYGTPSSLGGAPTCSTNYPMGSPADSIASGDVDGDGAADLVTAHADNNAVSVLRASGDCTFMPAVTHAAGSRPVFLRTADFNGDGRADVAVANRDSDDVGIFIGTPGGSLQPVGTYGTGAAPVHVETADFNEDGFLDLVTANHDGENVTLLVGSGDATFGVPITLGLGTPSASPSRTPSVAVADLDLDGHADLAVSSGDDVVFLRGRGDGRFQPAQRYLVGHPGVLAAGDFDGDGRVDLASGGEFSILLNSSCAP